MSINLPDKGFIFWPVGTGDSTTIAIQPDETTMQIDLHHLAKSEDGKDPHSAVVDELVNILPKKDKKPFLSVFVLTHPDKDHIKGFEDLLDQVTIGEIWHTPRVFNEYKKDLCDDAIVFKDEVTRRKDLTIKKKGNVEVGDMVRVIGHDTIFAGDDFKNFPEYWRTYPGNLITDINNKKVDQDFEAFVHAPFKEDSADDRNNTSLAMQVDLKDGTFHTKALFFGDREYPTVKHIFDKTREKGNDHYVEWDLMLAAHHCSKKVMYWKDEGEENEKFKKDIMGDFEEFALDKARIITSCESDFSDEVGKNPPHLKARKRYEEIVDSGNFLCTQEHPNNENPEPIIFEVGTGGLTYLEPTKSDDLAEKSALAVAIEKARGEEEPHSEKVGFGGLC